MSLALTLPLVGLLIGLPGIPGLNRLSKLHLPHKAAVDTLPPACKSFSRLAIEDQFVFAALPRLGDRDARSTIAHDQRRLEVRVDRDSGALTAMPDIGEVTMVGPD